MYFRDLFFVAIHLFSNVFCEGLMQVNDPNRKSLYQQPIERFTDGDGNVKITTSYEGPLKRYLAGRFPHAAGQHFIGKVDDGLAQPVQSASSSYFSGIRTDLGEDDDDFVDMTDHGFGGYVNNHAPVSYGVHHEKGDQGENHHKDHKSYYKGHTAKHGHEENKAGHDVESGKKSSNHDYDKHFKKGYNSVAGHKGEESAHKKGHKKGHKTKGYHSVHHKDEYKKDEIFYDDEHDIGHHHDFGHHKAVKHHENGGQALQEHSNSGYKHAHKGHHGDKENAHSYSNSKGHTGHEGHHSHKNHHSNYAKGSDGHEGEGYD